MLRRFVAALLALTLAVPFPAVAGMGACSMDTPALAAEPCSCCDSPATAPSSPCGTASAGAATGCGCSLRADDGATRAPASASSAPQQVTFAVEAERLPASWTTPQRTLRALALAASPPGAGVLVSRPLLCSWTI